MWSQVKSDLGLICRGKALDHEPLCGAVLLLRQGGSLCAPESVSVGSAVLVGCLSAPLGWQHPGGVTGHAISGAHTLELTPTSPLLEWVSQPAVTLCMLPCQGKIKQSLSPQIVVLDKAIRQARQTLTSNTWLKCSMKFCEDEWLTL